MNSYIVTTLQQLLHDQSCLWGLARFSRLVTSWG